MIDEFDKEYLQDDLSWARASLLGKFDGLSEYDARRPLTRTGTNLLGLVKHLTLAEARYFGAIFDVPTRNRSRASMIRGSTIVTTCGSPKASHAQASST